MKPILSLVCLGASGSLALAVPVAPTDLKVNALPNKIGLHLNEYGLSWKGEGFQSWRVLVASNQARLAAEVGDLWDSGRGMPFSDWVGEGSPPVRYRGQALSSGTTVWWKVRGFNEKEEAGPWSESQELKVPDGEETGRNQVVLVGGTLVSRMDKHSYLEHAITVNWPGHDISFRNLGWPADDVFGTARSEFGSAHNTRSWQPPKGQTGFGFEKLKGQLAETQPSTIMIGYGAEAAFADTGEKMAFFEAGYRGLVEELEKTGARLILLTPIAQVPSGAVLTADQADVHNARLAKASAFILALGKERGHLAIDLLSKSPFGKEAASSYQNGLHLNEDGYRRLAAHVGQKLGLESVATEPVRGTPVNLERTRLGVRYDLALHQLPSLLHAPVASAGKGTTRIWIDGEEVVVDARDGAVRSGPDYEQSGKLRDVIIEKNKLHRYKLNPINKAYIFLFRRHEMGHLAYEMKDFDELVKGKEQAIANLRAPRPHRYEHEDSRE
ncbi:MAG: hypothetical protein HRU37_10120, partial [Roseibacillus sp.]|nr:hypothetical protein [Roseibacillus sp.]